MRPSRDGNNLSITTRQAINNKAIVNHYRILCLDSGYIIDIGGGVLCNSRQQIIDHFIQQTKGMLKPLEIPEDYEMNLSIMVEDAESGELINQKLPTSPTLELQTLPQLGMAKEKPRAYLKIEPQAKPSRPIDLQGLKRDVNEELSRKLQQRRAAISE